LLKNKGMVANPAVSLAKAQKKVDAVNTAAGRH
jgi:hypothetical protein